MEKRQLIKKERVIVVVGRTGAGKSALCNKMSRTNSCKEGHTSRSETQECTTIITTWPHNNEMEVKFIDTPGFGDNGIEVTNQQLLSKILSFITSLEDGLNIVLFCVNAKDRFDAHDTEELDMLGLLLGSGLYEHLYVVVTQGNTLISEKREKIYKNFKKELPSILTEHGLPYFPEERILFADFDKFDEFLQPLTAELEKENIYKPQIAEGLDVNDPESVERFLQTPEMKKLMADYDKKLEEQKAKMLEMQNTITEKQKTLDETIAANRTKLDNLQNNINSLNRDLSEKDKLNDQIRIEKEKEKQRLEQELNKVNQSISSLSQQNQSYQKQLNTKNDQVNQLTARINQLASAQNSGGGGRRRRGCNLM